MFSGSLPHITQLSPGALRLLTKPLDSRHRAWAQLSQEIPQEGFRRPALEPARYRKAFADWALVEMISRDGAKLSIRL